MTKKVRSSTGLTTALVVIGWISFLAGQLIELPPVSIPLLAIARVLPVAVAQGRGVEAW